MWWITKKIKAAYEKGLGQGFIIGFRLGQLEGTNKTPYFEMVMEGKPATLAEKEIEAILQKAAEEDRERNNQS